MSVNKYKNHVFVLPEDRANHQIVHGFQLHESVNPRAIQVLPSPGGWTKVRDAFLSSHVAEMQRNPLRYVVLLVDFDENDNRAGEMAAVVPQTLVDRVFVVGVWSEPEDLRKAAGWDLERIGLELANECRDNSRILWNHPLLQHNIAEVDRMTARLKPFVFRAEVSS